MKRIYLLMILLVAFAANTFAQREINLEVTLVKPTSSQTIEKGVPVDMLAVIKNLGPDSLKLSDSTLWFWTLSGTPLPFPIGQSSGTYWNRFNRSLMVNDTFHLNYPGRSFNYTQEVDSNRTLCINVLPHFDGGGNDTIEDKSLTNNTSCVTLLFKKSVTSDIAEIVLGMAGDNKAAFYPNPASTQANIGMMMSYSAEVTVRLSDVTGRVVMTKELGRYSEGEHTLPVNVGDLQSGVYIYNIQIGQDISSGKLMIAK